MSQTRSFVALHSPRLTATVTALLLTGTGATFALASLAPTVTPAATVTLVEPVVHHAHPASTTVQAVLAAPLLLYRSELTRTTDTAEVLLKRLGVTDSQALSFLRTDTLVQQLLLGRAGRSVTTAFSGGNRLMHLVARWSPEDDGMFTRLTVDRSTQGFTSRVETLPMSTSTRLAAGVIQSSLFAATDEARIPDAVAVQMAEIFSGDIDFYRALRKDDHFAVVYEVLEGDGEPLRAGRVLSAEFTNAGKTFQATWFQEPLTSTTDATLAGTDLAGGSGGAGGATHTLSKGGYYTLGGESLRRVFLASPLAFSRLSSGFKMRFHPIFRTWQAHLGVDYAAPTGTPVRSVGDGVVEFSGFHNGFGNMVIVKHANSTQTVYAHLSRITVRSGQSISQGANLGLVGATGWATGPHLHFEFRVNGVHRDPLHIARRTESAPLAASVKPVFESAALVSQAQLAAARQILVGSAQ